MKKFLKYILIFLSFFLITNATVVKAKDMTNKDCEECAARYGGRCGYCRSCETSDEGKCVANKNFVSSNVKFDCSSDGVKRTMAILGTLLNWIQIIVPVFVVIAGCVSLFKAVMSSDDSLIKTAVTGLIVKVFIAAAIIFLPMIIFSIVRLVDDFNDSGKFSCITCLENPEDCQATWDWE